MNHELSEIRIIAKKETYPQLDFATIKNPWGHSPLLEKNQKRINSVSEDILSQHVGEWLSINPRSITLGANGSTEIIDLIPQLFIPSDNPCIMITPTYFGLHESLKKTGHLIIEIQTDPETGFTYNDTVIKNLFRESKNRCPSLIWFCSPNNPTGVVMDLDVIDHIAKMNPDTLIVVDEAYQEIVDPTNKNSMIHRINTLKNVLITKTFSKTWGLPEIKIGIAIGNEALVNKIQRNNVRPAINKKSLILAEAALLDIDHLNKTHTRIKDELSYMKTHVSAMNHISFGSDSQTGVCILRHDKAHLGEALKKRNIQSLDCNQIKGLEGLGYIRIGLQTHEKNKQFISHLWQLDSQL